MSVLQTYNFSQLFMYHIRQLSIIKHTLLKCLQSHKILSAFLGLLPSGCNISRVLLRIWLALAWHRSGIQFVWSPEEEARKHLYAELPSPPTGHAGISCPQSSLET